MLSNEEILLKLILLNNDTEYLREKGLTYSQISLLIQKCIDKGYINVNNFELNLTTEGKRVLREAETKAEIKTGMLLPQEKHYCTPVSREKIFLPKKL